MPANEGRLLFDELMRFKPDRLTANAWAVKAGVSRNFWNDLRRHGNPSRRTLEKLLAAAGSSLAEFEALRADGPPAQVYVEAERLGDVRGRAWPPARLPLLPVLRTDFGGEWGTAGSGIELTEIRRAQKLESAPRPGSLAGDADAFAITIVGDAMWPRFRPGRRVAVSPRSPVAIGDDVVVVLGRTAGHQAHELALIKELVGRTATSIALRQFNPDQTFQVEMAKVAAVHKVVGELF